MNKVTKNLLSQNKSFDTQSREFTQMFCECVCGNAGFDVAPQIPKIADQMQILRLFAIAVVNDYNEGWQPNWEDTTQMKYEPILYRDSVGQILCDIQHLHEISDTPFCFKTGRLAREAAEKIPFFISRISGVREFSFAGLLSC